MVRKVISGGQTGADRAGLDVAKELGLERGGWCPKGRRAQDGTIPPDYPMKETDSPEYPLPIRLNMRDSDGTLVLVRGKIGLSSKMTVEHAKKIRKPLLVVDLNGLVDVAVARKWLLDSKVAVLNVAGSRGSKAGIYLAASEFLRKLLAPTSAT